MTAFCAAALLLVVAADPGVADAARRDAEALEKLQQEVREALPAGWMVEISPIEPHSLSPSVVRGKILHDRATPRLVIRTARPILVRWESENPPGDSTETPMTEGQCPIALSVSPYLAGEQYAAAKAAAEAATATRAEFLTQRLGLREGDRNGWPLHPVHLKSDTDEQRTAAREYAFVWKRTELPPLPTHHYGGVAFIRYFDRGETPNDESKQKEHDAILAALDRILTRYDVAE